jgi:hypothetical protein
MLLRSRGFTGATFGHQLAEYHAHASMEKRYSQVS